MGSRVRIGDTEFELDFSLSGEEKLPPGVQLIEDPLEDEDSWPAGASAEMVAYAQELAISPEHGSHWVTFFTSHPQGQLAWEEIRRLWKPKPRKGAARQRR